MDSATTVVKSTFTILQPMLPYIVMLFATFYMFMFFISSIKKLFTKIIEMIKAIFNKAKDGAKKLGGKIKGKFEKKK